MKPMWCCLHQDLLIASCINRDVFPSVAYICEPTTLQMVAVFSATLESMNWDEEVFLFWWWVQKREEIQHRQYSIDSEIVFISLQLISNCYDSFCILDWVDECALESVNE